MCVEVLLSVSISIRAEVTMWYKRVLFIFALLLCAYFGSTMPVEDEPEPSNPGIFLTINPMHIVVAPCLQGYTLVAGECKPEF